MLLLKGNRELSDFVQSVKVKRLTLGFVPTMGALHEGHLALIRKAIEENQYTICSIFVNPTQFNNSEDLEKYPRTIEEDIKKLESIGCDALYLPEVKDIYPQGLENDNVNLGGLDLVMEGVYRPGHFEGVATVVRRFFLQVRPDKAYFGEKDFQQLQVIQRMVEVEKLPIQIVPVAIEREASGLALSSRNMRLSSEGKQKAIFIYTSLLKAKELFFNHFSPKEIVYEIEKLYKESGLELEYFIIAEESNLEIPEFFEKEKKYRAFVVAYLENVRLIDNIEL